MILVDEVDGTAGPRIVETIRVEPRVAGGNVDVDAVVRRHAALFPFLRCESRFPDQPQHSPIEVAMWRQMTALLGADFDLVESVNDDHQMPAGGGQAFSFGRFIRNASLR